MKAKILLRFIGPLIFVILFYVYVDIRTLRNVLPASRWSFFIFSLALIPPLIFIRSLRWQNILSKYEIFYTKWQCFKKYFVEMVAIMVVANVGTFAKESWSSFRPVGPTARREGQAFNVRRT